MLVLVAIGHQNRLLWSKPCTIKPITNILDFIDEKHILVISAIGDLVSLE